MKMRFSGPTACWAMLFLAACADGAHAKVTPVLGAPRKTIDTAWTANGRSGGCRRENLELTCTYINRTIQVAVTFDGKNYAEQFQTDGDTHRAVNMWHFLNALVPPGSRRLGCRFVTHSIGGGTAHACLYRNTMKIIVAYFPHPADRDFGGIVTYDYEDYKDIQAGL